MADAWYYAEAGNTVGPFSLGELKQVLARSSDWRSRLVWNAGYGDWRQAGTVPELEIPEKPAATTPPAAKKIPWWGRVLSLVVAVVAFAAVKALTHDLFKGVFNHPNYLQVETALDEAEKKAQVPQKIDEMTTLVSLRHSGAKELTYTYTLDTKNYNLPTNAMQLMRKTVVSNVCASNLKDVLGYGVTLWYQYNNADGVPIGSIAVVSSDCR